MGMSAFVLSKIFPSMNIDANQRFIFGLEGSPEPLGSFKIDNIFVPSDAVDSQTNFEMRNEALSGYRWIHTTADAETYGSFKLQKFLNADPEGIDIMTFNDDGTFLIPGVNDAKYIIQTTSINLPNAQSLGALTTGILKNTVTTGTGVLSTAIPGTDYATLANRLDQFAVPTASLNLNSQKIINLATPTAGTDAANKDYVDSNIGDVSEATYILKTADADLPNAQILGSLATGILKSTTTTGVLSIAITGTDYYSPADPGTLNFPRVGIGINPTVNGRIQFANTEMVNKISLFNSTGNDYNQNGFGYNNLGTLYHAQSFTSHTFYLGSSTSIPLRAHALGITIDELKPINSDFRRIMFYDNGENVHQCYNIGIKDIDGTNRAIHSQVGHFGAAFTWAAALTSSSSYELMSLSGFDLALRTSNISITEGVNFHKWNFTVKSDSTLSLTNSSIPANEFLLSSSSSSSILSVLNTNSMAVSNYRCGTSTDYIELGYDGSNDYSFINIDGPSNDRVAFRVGGVGIAAFLSSSLFGFGTITPTQARIVSVGGVANVASEDSSIRVTGTSNATKIELERTTGSGKLYELRSDNAGAFSIFDRTGAASRLFVNTSGNIGFGTTSPNGKVQLSNTLTNRQLVLWEGANNDHQYHGFGSITGGFRYNIVGTADRHIFYAGVNTTTSNELMRIQGNGIIAIGNTADATTAKLFINGGVQNVANEETGIRVVSALNNVKIELQATGGSGKLYEIRSSNGGNFDITDRTASATRFLITSAGNVGINMATASPNAALQLNNTTASRKFVFFESANNDHQVKGIGHDSGVFRFQTNTTSDSYIFYAGTSSSASDEVARIRGVGTFTIAKILGKTANEPGVAAGSAAGSSPTLTMAGSELSGTFQVVAGTTPSGTTIATFTLDVAMANSSYGVVITAANQSTAGLATMAWINVTSTTQFTINCATPLVATTTYKWNYHIIGC
jgi:hypothetical protein